MLCSMRRRISFKTEAQPTAVAKKKPETPLYPSPLRRVLSKYFVEAKERKYPLLEPADGLRKESSYGQENAI